MARKFDDHDHNISQRMRKATIQIDCIDIATLYCICSVGTYTSSLALTLFRWTGQAWTRIKKSQWSYHHKNKHDASWRITKKYNCIYIELLGETRVTRKHHLGNFWTLSVHPKFDSMIIHDGMVMNRRIALSMVHESQQAAIRDGGGGQTPNFCPPFQPPKLVAWSNPPVSQNPKRFAKSLHDYQRAQQCRWVSSLRKLVPRGHALSTWIYCTKQEDSATC